MRQPMSKTTILIIRHPDDSAHAGTNDRNGMSAASPQDHDALANPRLSATLTTTIKGPGQKWTRELIQYVVVVLLSCIKTLAKLLMLVVFILLWTS